MTSVLRQSSEIFPLIYQLLNPGSVTWKSRVPQYIHHKSWSSATTYVTKTMIQAYITFVFPTISHSKWTKSLCVQSTPVQTTFCSALAAGTTCKSTTIHDTDLLWYPIRHNYLKYSVICLVALNALQECCSVAWDRYIIRWM